MPTPIGRLFVALTKGVLTISFLAIVWTECEAQSQFRFKHFDPEYSIGNNHTFQMAQDGLGFLWMVDYISVTKFDGYEFKTYIHDPGDTLLNLGHEPIGGFGYHQVLGVDLAGNLWINNASWHKTTKNLLRYDRNKDGFISYTPDLGVGTIGCMEFDGDSARIWLGSNGSGLYCFNSLTLTTEVYVNGRPHPLYDFIYDLLDRGSYLLLATQDGLWKFDKATRTFSRPRPDSKSTELLYESLAFHFLTDPTDPNVFWLFVTLPTIETVILKIDRDYSIVQRFNVPTQANTTGWSIDNEGVIWISTQLDGLYRYDPRDSSFLRIRHKADDEFSLRDDVCTGVMVDRSQNVWVVNDDGLDQLRSKSIRFYNSHINANRNHGIGATVVLGDRGNEQIFAFGNAGNVWSGPLLLTDSIKFRTIDCGIETNAALIINWPGKTHLWLAAMGPGAGVIGLPRDSTGIITAGKVIKYRNIPGNLNTLSPVNVLSVYEAESGELWVGTFGELYRLDPAVPYGTTGAVTQYAHNPNDSNSIGFRGIHFMYPESKNAFWVATFGGVDLMTDGKVKRVFKNKERVRTVLQSKNHKIYIGTDRGLFIGQKNGEDYSFEKSKDVTEGILSIAEDKAGRIWLAGFWGLSCFDPIQRTTIRFSEIDGLLKPSTWGPQTISVSKDGLMIFKNFYGISIFDPMSLKVSEEKAMPTLTRITINNNVPSVAGHLQHENGMTIGNDIVMLDTLVLDHLHNQFSVQFSSMEHTAPEKSMYRHQLVGYDKDWIESNWLNRSATYTNLEAGDYRFKVMATNHHGVWSDQERVLFITILPPPWRTNWAYTGYGLLLIGMLFIARRTIVQRERLKSKFELEHLALEKAHEVDKAKTAFFTNISHEFRTPLTMIKGPVEDLLEDFSNNKKVGDRLRLVQHNADQLLKLVNQLLSLARLEAGAIKVDLRAVDLHDFLEPVVHSFKALSLQRGLDFRAALPPPGYSVEIDPEKVEMIVVNLLGNAIKFSSTHGEVSLEVIANPEEDQVQFVVSDTGIGIASHELDKIFERFYQVNNGEAHTELGTGIGLALVKELADVLGGTISVTSEEMKGSRFTFTLPAKVHTVTNAPRMLAGNGNGVVHQEAPAVVRQDSHDKAKLLVVEDNEQLRKFIIECFDDEFEFLEASNGKDGFEQALLHSPDLIISDVMMPVLDGMQMTAMIRKDARINHIPVIMLTAKATTDDKLDGLQYGAVDYITKPFDKREMVLKTRNIIDSHIRGRNKFRLEMVGKAPGVQVQSLDEKFLIRLKDAIHARLSDEKLSVDLLSEEIGFSRTQLYRKVRAVTGMPVNELIRHYRMHRAAQLLGQHWGGVSQVAYEVGYSNPSYFSKVFKEEFGVLPSEYDLSADR